MNVFSKVLPAPYFNNALVILSIVAGAFITLPVSAQTGFTFTGSMTPARQFHTATLLLNGKVLVAGGRTGGTPAVANTAQVYDPATGQFSATVNMAFAREYHTATLLPDGTVLITGGLAGQTSPDTAEIYDPATGEFSLSGRMTTPRYTHTATLLENGQVLLTGGMSSTSIGTTAELYNPATRLFSGTGSMATDRSGYHAATRLQNGLVLVTGGASGVASSQTAELYDPSVGTFSSTGNMGEARRFHGATLLISGKVLISGGFGSDGAIASAELFDPAVGAFAPTGNMGTARYGHTATLLAAGRVLITGGNGPFPAGTSAVLYDPMDGVFTATGDMLRYRAYHTATLLSDGKVLVGGGGGSSNTTNETAELYVANIAPVLAPIGNRTATTGQGFTIPISATDANGDTLYFDASPLPSGAQYNYGTNTFTWPNPQAGTYEITFTVQDNQGGRDTETITITVTTVNQAPTANQRGHETSVGRTLNFNLTGSDPNGDALTYTVTSFPSTGTLTCQGAACTYTPAGTYTGTVFLSFTVSDGTLTSEPATVYIVIGGRLGFDANGDNSVTVSDVFYMVNFLFADGPAPVGRSGAVGSGDANGDGSVTVSDVFYLVNHLFAGGPAPVAPPQ